MNHTQNVTLVLLSLAAVILAAMLLGALNERPAQAATSGGAKGDYTMIPMAWTERLDLLVVCNAATKKLIVYAHNPNTKAMDVVDKVDLPRVFAD